MDRFGTCSRVQTAYEASRNCCCTSWPDRRYGFGFVDGWHKVGRKFWPGVQAAAYLSSYFIGGRGHKAQITENVLASDLPRLVVFVGRDLTRATGCTMRSLRHSRRLWASRNLYVDAPRVSLAEWLAAAAMLSTRQRAP